MENASKALLIAGGVLIALIIITMFLMMFNGISNIQKQQEEQTKVEQIVAFNAEFEAYNKKVMYGTDVITLINKVAENNKKYSMSNDYKITVTLNGTVVDSADRLIADGEEKTVFTCVKTEYNALGRICKFEIIKKQNNVEARFHPC